MNGKIGYIWENTTAKDDISNYSTEKARRAVLVARCAYKKEQAK